MANRVLTTWRDAARIVARSFAAARPSHERGSLDANVTPGRLRVPVCFLGAIVAWATNCQPAASTARAPNPGSSLTQSPKDAGPSAPARAERGSASPAEQPAAPNEPASRASDSPDWEQPGRFVALEGEAAGSLIWLPTASRAQRLPLLVIAHGAGGSPAWHCDFWHRVARHAFLLCLRGKPMGSYDDAYYYPNHLELERLLTAALAEFDQRYGDRVQETGNVFVGYSQGATMGSLMIPRHASRFDNLLFIEGGYKYWTVRHAQDYAKQGGRRTFFACGTVGCEHGSKKSAAWLSKAGVRVQVAHARGAGHTPASEVGAEAAKGLAWLLSDDE